MFAARKKPNSTNIARNLTACFPYLPLVPSFLLRPLEHTNQATPRSPSPSGPQHLSPQSSAELGYNQAQLLEDGHANSFENNISNDQDDNKDNNSGNSVEGASVFFASPITVKDIVANVL